MHSLSMQFVECRIRAINCDKCTASDGDVARTLMEIDTILTWRLIRIREDVAAEAPVAA